MAERSVLDTSAILAFTDNEEGADEVQQLLEAARARQCVIDVCAISLMELAYITEREQGEDEAAHRLSVADALIAAVAKLSHATLVHKDPEFEALASQLVLRSLPFKPSRPPATM